jgi:isopenicillin N synthase-like dioxygenase
VGPKAGLPLILYAISSEYCFIFILFYFMAGHKDFGTCTLLFQDPEDTRGGLEVEDPHKPGHFVPAPPVAGAIVFNIGDFLMRWSNGRDFCQ